MTDGHPSQAEFSPAFAHRQGGRLGKVGIIVRGIPGEGAKVLAHNLNITPEEHPIALGDSWIRVHKKQLFGFCGAGVSGIVL